MSKSNSLLALSKIEKSLIDEIFQNVYEGVGVALPIFLSFYFFLVFEALVPRVGWHRVIRLDQDCNEISTKNF